MYLVDVYVLAKSDDIIYGAQKFIEEKNFSISPNLNKCWIREIETCKRDGMPVLGSFVGPDEKRAEFLMDKISDLEDVIKDFKLTLRQHTGELLLGTCFHARLRNVQRSLNPEGLGE